MTYTPGPWKLHNKEVRTAIDHPLGENLIATVHYRWEETSEEMWATGRLIAAAPEMLEALKYGKDNCPYCSGTGTSHSTTRWIQTGEYPDGSPIGRPMEEPIECQYCAPFYTAIAKAGGK